jgi:Protein of unknown function (DUF664)
MTDTPWEPPLAGTELEHLVGALDRLRTTFRWKVDDLDAAGLARRIGASALTLGGLLKHMAINEDFITTRKLTGEPVGEPWESLWDGTDDWEFTSAGNDTPNSCTRSGTTRLNVLARDWMRRWPAADSINSSTCPHPTVSMRACGAWCAT